MRRTLAVALLVTSLGFGGCTLARLWNPVYDRMEFDRSLVFAEQGVIVSVLSMATVNGGTPWLDYRLTNATGAPLSYRPDAARLVVGEDTLAPTRSVEARTLPPGETAEFSLEFARLAVGGEERETVLAVAFGRVETSGGPVRLPEVRFILPTGDFEGGRVWPYPSVAE